MGLHVSMQNLTLVQVEKRQRHLNQPVEDLVLRKVLSLARFDLAVDVSAIAVDHHYVQVLLSVHITIFVRHDVRMSNFLKQSNLKKVEKVMN